MPEERLEVLILLQAYQDLLPNIDIGQYISMVWSHSFSVLLLLPLDSLNKDYRAFINSKPKMIMIMRPKKLKQR